jgi:hypothetical protein
MSTYNLREMLFEIPISEMTNSTEKELQEKSHLIWIHHAKEELAATWP